MRYTIKAERRKELQDGRRVVNLCEILGLSNGYLIGVLTGKNSCSTIVAKSLISIKKYISMNNDDMEKYLEYYFTREEE